MNELKKWGAALMLAAMISVIGCALPVQAAPEATLDSFVPGAGVETLAPLKLKAQGADKALKGGVVWDGYKLAAVVRTEQGKIRDASLKGALDNGLMGMILSAMEEKGFVPAAADNDGAVAILLDKTAEQSREAAVEAMGSWAGDGKKALKLLFLPEKAFQSACAAAKGAPKPSLGDILKPYAKEKGYGLALYRKDDSFAVYIGTVAGAGEALQIGR
ncbi:MAG: hypothetical protein K6E40_06840 [Desulfovibrio sp.]|jgi:hypothetical protein|nr:hypothetical protein [Desulfovibrio sp.]